jgi:hypothetical protein
VLEWEELEKELEGVQLTDEEDSVRWMLTPHGQFTTASLYRFWTYPGVRDKKNGGNVVVKTASEGENTVWLVIRNIIQTADNLGKKRWQGSNLCQLCDEEENTEHLVFRCPIAVFMWAVIGDGLEWVDRPRN